MLGDDHDYSADDPGELEEFFSDMGEIVDGQKDKKAEGLSAAEHEPSSEGSGGRSEAPPPKAA